jgi:uncharacterized protein YdhG (YjbR/CyaY superfamily)
MPDTRLSNDKKTRGGFTAEERAAMREHVREMKRRGDEADAEAEVVAKIAEMSQPDRGMAERIHAIAKETAPDLTSRTWYGMPAYAKNGKIVFFFQPAEKFKARYGTLGFTDEAKLDEGDVWPNSYAVQKVSPVVEKEIRRLIEKAVG